MFCRYENNGNKKKWKQFGTEVRNREIGFKAEARWAGQCVLTKAVLSMC